MAAQNGELGAVRALLAAGAAASAPMAGGGPTPLHFAAALAGASGESRPLAVLTALLEGGADLNAAEAEEGSTPLHWAVRPPIPGKDASPDKGAAAVMILLAAGADPLRPDSSGVTPLALAAEHGLRQLEGLLSHAAAQRAGGGAPGALGLSCPYLCPFRPCFYMGWRWLFSRQLLSRALCSQKVGLGCLASSLAYPPAQLPEL